TLPLPAQLTLMYSYNGMPIPIKDTYYVLGQPGLRTAWALGGRIDGGVLFDLLGGSGSIEAVLIELLPYFSLLDHGVRPTVDVFAMPLVADADDIDGDGDTGEQRPDWAQFTDLDLAPAQPQSLAVQVNAPALPTLGGAQVRTAVILAGSLTALGFTPLGMTSAQSDNGELAPVVMKLAPPYGGLEQGTYATLVLGFPPGTQQELPTSVAGVMRTGADLPTQVDFATGFLPFPEDAHWDAALRSLVSAGVAGAGLYRATFSTDAGAWMVYMPASGAVALELPEPPAGLDDLASGARVTLDPMALGAGLDFEGLVGFDGDDLDQLNRLAVAFTTFTLP
ncbi:MAG TPA: hypothetical protein P5076_11285, partial [Myxococcota bacterium]|nr:hypothetical protein [Myxococcota bacterium]